MIEQQGNALTFLAFFVASKVGKTGLVDVTVDVRKNGVAIVTGGAATEEGGGLYYYTLVGGSVDAAGRYSAVFKTGDGTVDVQHIPALWVVDVAGVENLNAAVSSRSSHAAADVWVAGTRTLTESLDPTAAQVADAVWDEALAGHAAAGSAGQALSAAGSASDPLLNTVPGSYSVGTAGSALGKIGTGQVTAVQPVSADSSVLTLTRGDDYHADDGKALGFSSADWPDLTGATEVRITIRRRVGPSSDKDDDVLLTATDTVASRVVGAGTQSVSFNLTAAKTALLEPGIGAGKFDVQATVATRLLTLAVGRCNIVEDQTR